MPEKSRTPFPTGGEVGHFRQDGEVFKDPAPGRSSRGRVPETYTGCSPRGGTRLIVILAIMVILPLVLLSWLGLKTAEEEYSNIRVTFQNLLKSKLSEMDHQISSILEERRLLFQKLTDLPSRDGGVPANRPDGDVLAGLQGLTGEDFQKLPRDNPFITNCFSQASNGFLIFPDPKTPLTDDERAFLVRSQSIFDQKILLSPRTEKTGSSGKVSPDDGWHVWFWDNDIHIIYYGRTPEGGAVGFELSRVRLLSDIIGALPEAPSLSRFAGNLNSGSILPFEESRDPPPGGEPRWVDPMLASGCMALVDSQNRSLYRWGNLTNQLPPILSMPLSPPLRHWSLQLHAPMDAFTQGFRSGIYFQVFTGLFVVGLTLSILAFFLYREHARSSLEAEQRVSFVNQVSHELKTPLTNIRMYAELLEGNLPDEDLENRKRLEIITMESRRLSRLIGNVLTFSKHRKGKLEAKPRLEIPDRVIVSVVENFRPVLASKGISVKLDLNAAGTIPHDPDILGQIFGNLISNVEKYGSAGGTLIVKSLLSENILRIWVRDFGPGIPADKAETIFEPFTRLSERPDEGVSGTGIGLSIARDLARLHGGDVELVYSNGWSSPQNAHGLIETNGENPDRGSCFLARIPALPIEKKG